MALYNRKPKIEKKCLTCKTVILVKPSLQKRKKFCSKICLYKWLKTQKFFLGYHHSKKVCKKMSIQRKGRPAWNKGLIGYCLGQKRPKMSEYKGINHWSWKGGISKDRHCPNEPKYKEWRTKVFIRDNWKCKIADENCKGQLQVHHILRWAEYPELRYNINNGITLCQAHHPRKRAEEKRLSPYFTELVSASK